VWGVRALGKPWTQDEIDILRRYLEETPSRQRDPRVIAEKLGRTYVSVTLKANRHLGLRFSQFSPEELEQIRSYYQTTPVRQFNLSEIASRIGRPRTSVSVIAHKLGLSDLKRPKRIVRHGEQHPGWKGDSATCPAAGHRRARVLYPDLGPCERCKLKPAVERHHVDGNTLNNAPNNIQKLCRRCHMIVDGRLVKFSCREDALASRISWQTVRDIRASMLPRSQLAKNHGVSKTTISRIKNNEIWKEAPV